MSLRTTVDMLMAFLWTLTGLQVNVTTGSMAKKLKCSSTCTLTDNPTYTWYKKNVTSSKASEQSYIITNIRSDDSGEYYCEAKNEYGRLNSSAVFVDIQWKEQSVMGASVGVTVGVLVLILCLFAFMGFRKMASKSMSSLKRTTKDTADNGQVGSSPLYDNISRMEMISTEVQTEDTDNKEDLHYASVHFSSSKNQEVPLYSTNQKLEEDIQYAAVNLNASMLPSRESIGEWRGVEQSGRGLENLDVCDMELDTEENNCSQFGTSRGCATPSVQLLSRSQHA